MSSQKAPMQQEMEKEETVSSEHPGNPGASSSQVSHFMQGMQSAPSISHGFDDEIPEDGDKKPWQEDEAPSASESSEHWMMVREQECVDFDRYCYFVFQYWHTNVRYRNRNKPAFAPGRLRSACWLIVRVDRQQLVHGNLMQASKEELLSLNGECMFAHCGIWEDRPIPWHRSPWHGDARFRRSPVYHFVEVFIVNFHFCGENLFAKELEFEAMLPQRSWFSGYCVGGQHHAEQWCIVCRARAFERNPRWLEIVFNYPVMVREHRLYESFLYHMD